MAREWSSDPGPCGCSKSYLMSVSLSPSKTQKTLPNGVSGSGSCAMPMQLGDAWSMSTWVMKQVGLFVEPSDEPFGSHLSPPASTNTSLPSGQPPVLTFPTFGTVS